MKIIIRFIMKTFFPKMYLHHQMASCLLKSKDSYLYITGWMKSFELKKPIDNGGDEVPWMNYSIVKFLRERLRGDLNLFEFGSGYSTKFYAKLVQTVTSVEYDQEWLQVVKQDLPANAELLFRKKDVNGEYCRMIKSTQKRYDVVIVDGRDRVNCIKQSIDVLTDVGVILLDDSQRDRYHEGLTYSKSKGFLSLDFEGLKPTGIGMDRTTILYRRDNCFGI